MRALDEWIGDLQGNNGEVERAAEVVAEALGHTEDAVRERAAGLLIEALPRTAPAPRARMLNLLQIHWWPPTARNSGPAYKTTRELLPALELEAPELLDITLIWAHVARIDASLVSPITADLKHAQASVRKAAAGALGRVGEAAAPSIAKLIKALADPVDEVGDAALESLSALAPFDADRAVPALAKEIGRSQGARQFLAMMALRGVLEEAVREGLDVAEVEPTLLPTLRGILRNEEPAARLQAASLLGLSNFEGEDAQHALLSALEDESPDVQVTAAVALLRLDVSRKEARAVLEAQLLSEVEEDAEATLVALDSVEDRTLRRARSVLETGVKELSGPLRKASKELLVRAGPRAPSR